MVNFPHLCPGYTFEELLETESSLLRLDGIKSLSYAANKFRHLLEANDLKLDDEKSAVKKNLNDRASMIRSSIHPVIELPEGVNQ